MGMLFAACRKPGNPASTAAPSPSDTMRRDTMTTSPDSLGNILADTLAGTHDTLATGGKIKSKPGDRREAPRHGSPDQAEIDSLKKAKGGKKG